MDRAALLAANWITVGKELGIEVVAPYCLRTPGAEYEFPCLVPEFGARRGMVIMVDFDQSAADAAAAEGFGYSCLEPDTLDVEYAVECLMDWGWSDKGRQPPNWYVEQGPDDDDAA
jgi:hypothetical protein